jgi:hypothetical protein
MHDIKKWKNNGLPRKGWVFYDIEDSLSLNSFCEWCGTSIRYIHILFHPDNDILTNCGCICAEHLTEDYVNPKKREKNLKSHLNKIKRLKKTVFKNFRQSKNGNYYFKCDGLFVLIYKKNLKYKLKINEIWGKKEFNNFENAFEIAWDFIKNDMIEKYITHKI